MEENRLVIWLGEFSEYKIINDILIPTSIKASWLLKEGKHTYVDFQLKEIDYNKPALFQRKYDKIDVECNATRKAEHLLGKDYFIILNLNKVFTGFLVKME